MAVFSKPRDFGEFSSHSTSIVLERRPDEKDGSSLVHGHSQFLIQNYGDRVNI